MSGGFSNPIVGGGGALVYPSVHSPNFNVANPLASPSPSWAILKNGLAYLFGLIITGGTITGPDYIINPAGAFFYNGAPATGNMLASIAGAPGTDAFGNVFTAGIYLYGPGGSQLAMKDGASGNPQLTFQPANVAHLSIQPTIVSFAQNAGAVNELLELVISSGKESGNADAALQLFSATADATGAAVAILEFGGQVGLFVGAAGLTACQPGTAATPEIWHPLGSAGATGCTQLQARYMLSADGNFCVVDVALEAGAGGSTAGTYTFANTLGAGWQFPGAFLRNYPLAFNAPITTATQDSVIVVDGNAAAVPGRVRITIPAVAANVFFTGTAFVPIT